MDEEEIVREHFFVVFFNVFLLDVISASRKFS